MMHTLQSLQRSSTSALYCELHNKPIDFGCTNKECLKQRHGCFKCIQDNHKSHIKEVLEFENIKLGIDKCLQETDEIIFKIDEFIKQAFKGLIKIREQLMESKVQFNKFPGDLNKTELSLVIDEVVQSSQGRYQKIMEKVTKYIDQFNSNTDQGQSIFIEDNSNITIKKVEPEIDPDDIFLIQINERIETLIPQIKLLIFEQNYPEALVLADEALNLNPDKDEFKIYKADIYYLSGQYNKAGQIYEEILKKNPKDHQMQARLGQIYMDQFNYAKAAPLYQDLTLFDPKNIDFAFKHGRCLQEKQQHAEAYTIFLKLENDYPPNPNVKCALGQCLFRMGQLRQAVSYWTEAVLYGHSEKQKIQGLIDQFSRQL